MGCCCSRDGIVVTPEPVEPGDLNSPKDNKPDNKPDKDPRPAPGTPDVIAKVERVEFYLHENKASHYTTAYEKEELIVRRGQAFDLGVVLKSRSFDPNRNRILLRFQIDVSGGESLKYDAAAVPSLDGVKTWAFHVASVKDDVVHLRVMTPPEAVVAMYRLTVITENDSENEQVYEENSAIFVLFNAWCKDDAVFLEDEKEREEYVLDDEGIIWRHPVLYKGKEWFFGQFKAVSLDCAICLLFEMSNIEGSHHLLGDPVLASRTLAAMVNKSGSMDHGLLVGNWSGNYDDGTNPSAWDGSVGILEEFMETWRPVQYGQCWVFSGVLTTLCRTVGIPTRSVTNFSSAHDTDGSVTIDSYYDKDGEPIKDNPKYRTTDSVWNFHVWNECWFKRNDIPSMYDGWQVVDSTPQEYSHGGILQTTMVCGPAPVTAVKEGDLVYGRDTAFVFAEVNGDRVYWEVDVEKDEKKVGGVDRDYVGDSVITKVVGADFGHDIISTYKYSGEKEKEVLAKAVGYGNNSKFVEELYGAAASDVHADVIPTTIPLGKDITLNVKLQNKSKEVRTVFAKMQVRAAFYTGVVDIEPCKREENEVKLQPGEEKNAEIHLTVEDYIDSLHDANSILKAYFHGDVKETGQVILKSRDYIFADAELGLTCPEEVDQHTPFKITVKLNNPFPRPLAKCILHIEGSEIVNQTLKHEDIPPDSEFVKEVEVTPVVPAMARSKSYLHVSFTCTQLTTSKVARITVNRGI